MLFKSSCTVVPKCMKKYVIDALSNWYLLYVMSIIYGRLVTEDDKTTPTHYRTEKLELIGLPVRI